MKGHVDNAGIIYLQNNAILGRRDGCCTSTSHLKDGLLVYCTRPAGHDGRHASLTLLADAMGPRAQLIESELCHWEDGQDPAEEEPYTVESIQCALFVARIGAKVNKPGMAERVRHLEDELEAAFLREGTPENKKTNVLDALLAELEIPQERGAVDVDTEEEESTS